MVGVRIGFGLKDDSVASMESGLVTAKSDKAGLKVGGGRGGGGGGGVGVGYTYSVTFLDFSFFLLSRCCFLISHDVIW